jgi:PKD repeat protein
LDGSTEGTVRFGNDGSEPLTLDAGDRPPWLDVRSAGEPSILPGASATWVLVGRCGSTEVDRDGQLTVVSNDPERPRATVPVRLSCAAEANQAPSAEVLATPESGSARAPATVRFRAEADDADGTIAAYAWSIDGREYEGAEVEHVFATAGRYEVDLRVRDDEGATTAASADYVVLPNYRFTPAEIALDLGEPTAIVEIAATGRWELSTGATWLAAEPERGDAGRTRVVLEVDGVGGTGADARADVELRAGGSVQAVLPVVVRLPDLEVASQAPVVLLASVGGGTSGSIDVRNAGAAPLSVQASTASAWLDVAPGVRTVPAGDVASIDVVARCGATPGSRVGEIVLVSDDPDRSEVRVGIELACLAPPPSSFDIELRFYGSVSPTAAQLDAFDAARARWSEAIVGDLPDQPVSVPTTLCPDGPSFSGTVDDLVLFASVETIDGAGGILGRAGPCRLRSGSGLPFAGIMALDGADLDALEAQGALDDVIVHEMAHVLGFGTLWGVGRDLVQPACSGTGDPRFVGAGAVDAHEAEGGEGAPHVETDGGAGTACAHWDEDRYGHELMTGFLNLGTEPVISRTTIASLGDLGYEVDLSSADPYVVPPSGSLRPGGMAIRLREELVLPIAPER